MKSITLKSHIGKNNILSIPVPAEMAETDVEVVVLIRPISDNTKDLTGEASQGWLPDFFEQTAGGWQGEPLMRGEQPPFETRNKFS